MKQIVLRPCGEFYETGKQALDAFENGDDFRIDGFSDKRTNKDELEAEGFYHVFILLDKEVVRVEL